MTYENNLEFARQMDLQDPLGNFRDRFLMPQTAAQPTIYFCGNSLGLQPVTTKEHIAVELEDWGRMGVKGHFHARNPWVGYHHFLKTGLVELTGAKGPLEVTPMGSLTTNLHLMMVSFYRPTATRFKIIMESDAFPSDQYALQSQCQFHGLDPETAIIELKSNGEKPTLTTEEITRCIAESGDQVALVLLSGVQYYTGQLFDIEAITAAGHECGAMVGWDLAHAIGNVPLDLHNHQVDFAVWCSYKYLNSGPGATAGIFVHEKHSRQFDLPRFGGWWGHLEEERFQMKKGFIPMAGSDGWQLSNANVLSMAAQKASLEIFREAGVGRLRAKSISLTGYLYYLLHELSDQTGKFTIITPESPEARGCQLSLLFKDRGKEIFGKLTAAGVVVDWREPNAIRVAPVPLYNTYEEVFHFGQILKDILNDPV